MVALYIRSKVYDGPMPPVVEVKKGLMRREILVRKVLRLFVVYDLIQILQFSPIFLSSTSFDAGVSGS